jgi:hypothetical protein
MPKIIGEIFAVLLLTSCADGGLLNFNSSLPSIDPYNDPNAYRINQDIDECQQLAKQATGEYSDAIFGYKPIFVRAYSTCLRNRGHRVVEADADKATRKQNSSFKSQTAQTVFKSKAPEASFGTSASLAKPATDTQTFSAPLETSRTETAKPPQLRERRIALIIGNSQYRDLPRLDNPQNDAELIAATLQKLGFKVIGGKALLDLGKAETEKALQTFTDALQQSDSFSGIDASVVSLFYYAGHGIQARGENYLIPVDANPTKESDFNFQLVNVNLILRSMESAGTALNMVILDACRNNPIGGRGLRGSSSGLAEMKAPEGTLISFATQSGNVAQDGPAGGNSPFALALAWGIQQPGLDQFGAFNRVGVRVKKMTAGAQQPWMSNSPIEGEFFFSRK